MIYPWGTGRRLNAYSDYFKKRFGERVQKITIDAGFTCPNRDGTRGRGGCTFCDNKAFNPSYNDPGKSIAEQIRQGMEFHRTRYRKASQYLAYFQAYTNTYADLSSLKSRYDQALEIPGIIGIVIGTRPDCVDEEKLDYFRELSERSYVVVEYGIESLSNKTLQRVNRGHDVEKSIWAIRETAKRGIRVGGHMIIGLPGETEEDFLESAIQLSQWPLNNIKFHQLQVIRGTAMEAEFQNRPEDFVDLTMEEYLQLMREILERLNPAFVVERIAGEVSPGMSLREGWGVRYDVVLRTFEELLEQHDTWQGKYYKSIE
ncbi:MAG: TIGR01212 family radical SAM protein [Bacteroidota bacterium]